MAISTLYIFAFIGIVVTVVHGQFYMFTPGTSIEPYVNSPLDTFGAGSYCGFSQNVPCGRTSPYVDPSMCQHLPSNVTPTPYIEETHLRGSASEAGSIFISCIQWTYDATIRVKMFFTTNGTLPDVNGPCYPAGDANCIGNAYVPFDAVTKPVIVVRCVEPGKLPSRIAYARRLTWESSNGTWCEKPQAIYSVTNPYYRELSLPRCDPKTAGTLCDGQSIVVGQPIVPSPLVIRNPTPTPTDVLTQKSNGVEREDIISWLTLFLAVFICTMFFWMTMEAFLAIF